MGKHLFRRVLPLELSQGTVEIQFLLGECRELREISTSFRFCDLRPKVPQVAFNPSEPQSGNRALHGSCGRRLVFAQQGFGKESSLSRILDDAHRIERFAACKSLQSRKNS